MKAEKKTFADWSCLHFNSISIFYRVLFVCQCMVWFTASLPRPRHLRGASPWHLLIFGHAGAVLSAFGQKGVRRRETDPRQSKCGMLWHVVAQWEDIEGALFLLALMGFFHHHRLLCLPNSCDGRHRRSDIEWHPCDQDASVPFRSLMKLIGVVQDRL